MAYDEAAAARIRGALPAAGTVTERRMMGALCFMVDGHMCCGVTGSALMIRVGQNGYAAALAKPHVRPMDLGGRPFRVMLDITLPLIAPAMLAGWLLAFTLSLDDLVLASFVSGPGANTLPMLIFSKVKLGVKPDINALATLIILFITIGVIVAWLATRRTAKN